jgi:hypothetical protein
MGVLVMKTYAIIENGTVINIATAAGTWPFSNQTAIDITNQSVGIGWTWDGSVFSPPPSPPPGPRPITKLALYERATDEELVVLDAFLTTQATVRQRLRWADAVEIDRNDPEVIAVTTGLFGAGRAAEILA